MTTAISTDLIKLGHLFAEIMSSHDMSRFDEITAANYVNHNALAEPGREGSKKALGAIIAGVPDLKVTAEDVFVSIDIWRVENGRFVEHWDELNTLDVFIQIGAVPPPRLPS
jgi:predicted SnoaL-like aldol condensation-catalyzing enzyme